MGAAASRKEIEPIVFSVLTGSMRSLVNEMNLTMFRSARSPVITEGRDIGGALFDASGRLVAQGDWDLAVFVGMLEFSVKAILERFGDELAEGDAFIANDPFVGGTHFNDVGVVRPVFDGGRLVGFVAIVGHWPDVGGQEPGSFVANAREYFQEGMRIPPTRVVARGVPERAVFDLIEANMRLAADRIADLRAQMGATAVGARRLAELGSRYGWGTVERAMAAAIDHSERLMRAEIARMPDGVYRGEDSIDMQSLDHPEPRTVRVEMRKAGESLVFDFGRSDPQALSASNSTLSATCSAVYVTVKSLFPKVPMSHGCFAPIEILATPGTIVNAQPPAAISSMAATVYEKVIGACMRALAEALPQRSVGCPYNLVNLTIGGSAEGSDYVAYLYSEGGFGARVDKDGPAGLVSLFGGGAKITPAEVMERRYPIRFSEWALRPDSGGPGRYRGGVGSRKTFEITAGTARLSCLGDREKFPPFGVHGGEAGAAQGLRLNAGEGGEGGEGGENLTLKAVGVELAAGDSVTIVTGGGGGYGDPMDRDPRAVAADVRDGFVGTEAAAERYGVVFDGAKLDLAATLLLRERRRAEPEAGR